MNKEKVILWGVGKIAEVVHFYLTEDSDYEVCAFCVDKEYKDREVFRDLPVECFDEIEKNIHLQNIRCVFLQDMYQ